MIKSFILRDLNIKRNAIAYVANLPVDEHTPLVVTIKEQTRNLEQNAALWAALSDVSEAVVWHGQKLTPEDWKNVFTGALRGQKMVPGIDGNGFVVIGTSASRMSKREFSDLLELIYAFGSERGVIFDREAA